jgi:hypothetical protein
MNVFTTQEPIEITVSFYKKIMSLMLRLIYYVKNKSNKQIQNYDLAACSNTYKVNLGGQSGILRFYSSRAPETSGKVVLKF